MSRSYLLRTLSVAALAAALSPAAHAKVIPVINGGGATSPQADYAGSNDPKTGAPRSEMSLYNSTATTVQFGTYWGSGSGVGQQAFLNDDLTCDINKVTGANGGNCSNTRGGVNTVHYGTSDTPLNSTQVATWATSSFGQTAAGNLVQIPSLGTGEAIVINDTNVTANGQVTLSDNDLCGIFSGKITDFSQITDSATKPAAGVFKFVYRTDSAAPTYLITNHLSAVCNASNSKAGVTFTATTTFANLFTSLGGINAVIPNAVGESLNQGVANYLAGLSNGVVPQAIGYVSPDWTTLTPNSPEVLSNGQPSPLLVAALLNGKKTYLPTTTNVTLALSHVSNGVNTTPPSTAAQGANPLLWIPVIKQVSTGYPIVGYGTFDLAECYSSKPISKGILAFLKDHYSNASYKTIQGNNAEVPIANSGASKFLATVNKNIIANANAWNINIGNATACTGKAGR
jgi:phosphate transport system substrate-binding protein